MSQSKTCQRKAKSLYQECEIFVKFVIISSIHRAHQALFRKVRPAATGAGSFLTAAVRFVVAVETFEPGAFCDVDAFFPPAFVTMVVPALAVLISLSPFSLAMAAESAVPGRLGCLLGGREEGGSEENVL